jgi:hypothetical protein
VQYITYVDAKLNNPSLNFSNIAMEVATKELYGGAITVELPKPYIDASDFRQIPDHQEVFLSQETLTSVIFEINQYVETSTETSAVHFHFTDVIEKPDRLAEPLGEPSKETMMKLSLKDFPAYVLLGAIVAPEVDKQASYNLPVEWQRTPQTVDRVTKVLQLVIRLQKYETDLCVRINVPMKEMKNNEQAGKEEAFAKAVMEKFVETLDIKDFGLFGTD